MEEEGWHRCYFCGEDVNKEGYESKGGRHFLSDCRPDLVEHEHGDTCTWAFRRTDSYLENCAGTFPENYTCYAYQDRKDGSWTMDHKHFYPDGPM